MMDLNTNCSESTFETETCQVLEHSEHLTPKGESSWLLPSEKHSVELDGSHTVTCTFTVSLAVPALPAGQKQKESNPPGTKGERIQAKQLGACPCCYHIEYFLLPDDLVPRKLELVFVGVVAKLFTESSSKAITPWFENEKMWVSWKHSVDIRVTNEYLIKLRDHKISFKIWNTIDKVSSKTRLRKSSSLEGDTEADNEVKQTVLSQRKTFEESQPAPSCTKIKAAKEPKAREKFSAFPVEAEGTKLDGRATSASDLPQASMTQNSGMARSVLFAKRRSGDKDQLVMKEAGAGPPVKTISKKTEKNSNVGILTYGKDKATTSVRSCLPSTGRRGSGPKSNVDATLAKAHGIALLQLDAMPLLAGENSVISHLADKNLNILDGYVSFTVETPLLSERQRRELNPLIIRINSATRLPNTPVPVEVLERLCVPTYCKYKFHNFPPHRTHGQVHGTHVYFKDVNVLLTGTMKPGELQSCLRGPPLEIEVHDQDRNMENLSFFEEGDADEEVGHASFSTCKSTIRNSFVKNNAWHPHGVAKVSLTDLSLGRSYLSISAPIRNCTAVCSEKDKNKKMTESMTRSSVLPVGHYLESDSLLKVQVEIAVPLGMQEETARAQITDCPYSCIIYIFDYANSSLLHYLVEEIREINTEALWLDCDSVHSIRMALAAAKLETTLEKVCELDIVTGFHLLDGVTHLFVLEGLKDKAIKRLWDRHFERTYRREDGQLEILYNSQLAFHQRLYTDLEAIFYHFRLCQPLHTITKQPLLYVRGSIPWACFQALSRLSYLCRSKRLRHVIHGYLLPSAEMITALCHEYGAPLTPEDLFTQKPPLLPFSSDDCTVPGKVSKAKQAGHSALDNYNRVYDQQKKEGADKRSFERRHVQAGIDAVSQLKGKVKKPKLKAFRIYPEDGKSVFNYSSQSLNSAELAKKYLRQEMAKEPKKRFTYCHKYLSATFEPVDVFAAHKESLAKSKSMWLSLEGFVSSGFKSSWESNLHPQMTDEKRQENALHADVGPALPRDRWRRDKRQIDFDLYKKPHEFFLTTAPQPGGSQILQTTSAHTKPKVHQSSAAPKLSMCEPRARFQLEKKLQELLEDKPLTLSCRKAGQGLEPVPAPPTLDNQPGDTGPDAHPGGRRSSTSGFIKDPDNNQHSLKWSELLIREQEELDTGHCIDFRLLCSKHSFSRVNKGAAPAPHEQPLQATLHSGTECQHWGDPSLGMTQNSFVNESR